MECEERSAGAMAKEKNVLGTSGRKRSGAVKARGTEYSGGDHVWKRGRTNAGIGKKERVCDDPKSRAHCSGKKKLGVFAYWDTRLPEARREKKSGYCFRGNWRWRLRG